ncbi:MAG: ABC transporter permease [Bdellovibrionales bacterium]|nr:ABC transporter permease [Bdellovibrionales bacterium]
MFYRLWLKRIIFSPTEVFRLTSLFSVFGLVLGVAVLTVALLTVNGFSRSLQKVIVDRNGHFVFLSEEKQSLESFSKKLEPYQSSIRQAVPFLSFAGLVANSQELKGVIFEGLDFKSFSSELPIQQRLVQGKIDLKGSDSFVILGRFLAEDLGVRVGDLVQTVFVDPSGQMGSSRKTKTFPVKGIVDMGKHDLNSRLVLMPLSASQKFMGQEDQISGLRIWLQEESQANYFVRTLNNQYRDRGYQAVSWRDMEKSFFNNINSDKQIIFFVLLILIIAAGFNVSSALFVQVFKRTREISILKAMGAGNSIILKIFLLRGWALV